MPEVEENTGPTSQNASQDKNSSNFWKELVQLVLLALIIIVPFRYFIAEPFIVDGMSMDPTFENGQYLIVDRLSYRFHEPKRGEVLVFRYPQNPKKHFIKRIIGLPGEKVSIEDGRVRVFNADYPDGLWLDEPYVVLEKKDSSTYNLEAGEYFVMGDNRLQSADSRFWGPVPRKNFVGRPFLRFFPPGVYPGTAAYASPNEE